LYIGGLVGTRRQHKNVGFL